MAPEPRRSAKLPDRVASMDNVTSGKKNSVRSNNTKTPSSVPAMSTNNMSAYPATPMSYSTPYYGGYGGSYYSSGFYPPSYPANGGSSDPISWIYSLSYTMSSLSQLVQVLSCHSNSIYHMITSTIAALNRIADAIRNEGEFSCGSV